MSGAQLANWKLSMTRARAPRKMRPCTTTLRPSSDSSWIKSVATFCSTRFQIRPSSVASAPCRDQPS